MADYYEYSTPELVRLLGERFKEYRMRCNFTQKEVPFMIFHVSVNGSDCFIGTEDKPFRSIQKAASIALPGDTVRIHAGIYREWVSPANGGTEDHRD